MVEYEYWPGLPALDAPSKNDTLLSYYTRAFAKTSGSYMDVTALFAKIDAIVLNQLLRHTSPLASLTDATLTAQCDALYKDVYLHPGSNRSYLEAVYSKDPLFVRVAKNTQPTPVKSSTRIVS